MQLSASVALLALVAAALSTVSEAETSGTKDGHPIEKVIKLLNDLSVKVEAEGKAEALLYDKFVHWCTRSKKSLGEAIVEENEAISSLKNQISGEEQQIASLTDDIAALEKELGERDVAAKNAERLRAEEAGIYQQASADYKATIAAIRQAIDVLLESQANANEPSLEQVSQAGLRRVLALADSLPNGVSKAQRDTIAAFLQEVHAKGSYGKKQRPTLAAEGDLEEHVKEYSFKSGKVIEILKDLHTRFENELLVATNGETNALNAYDLENQARDQLINAAENSKKEKEGIRTEVQESMLANKLDLSKAEEDLKDDTATLADTQGACLAKQQEWEARSDVRSKELEAMGAAVEILAKVTGVQTKAPANPVLPPAPVEADGASFLQLANPRQRAVNLLRSKARTLHSSHLARVAEELSAHLDDPFGEVNNMIEKMIYHLMDEQTDEDNHKFWCDGEMSKTNASKDNKEEKIKELTARIDVAVAKVQLLSEDIKAANKKVAEIVAFAAEATRIRKVGKTENAAAIKDAQSAQTALAEANSVITAFYKETGEVRKESWEFLQRGVELSESPSTWDASYTGVADPKNQPAGIISVLEQVQSDFAKMEADTRAQENEDQKLFEDQMKAFAIEKADRSKESELKSQDRMRLSDKLSTMKGKRKQVAGELEAVEQYYHDLGPACYHGDSTYEDRKSARAAEVTALKEAKGFLAGAFDDAGSPAPGAAALVALVRPRRTFMAARRHH